MHIIEELDNAY